MTPQEKQFMQQQLVVVLQDNVGQRLTVALANGILSQFLDAVPAELAVPDAPAQEPQT